MRKTNLLALCILNILSLSTVLFAQNLKPADIIAKHLSSIGTKEIRDQVKNRLATGLSEFHSKLPNITGGGKALVVSDSGNLFFLLSLNSKEYPYEKIGYFSHKVSLPYVTAGTRSPLGAFIADHAKLLDNGLFAGSMSSRWALLDPQQYGGKINSAGMKKIDGRKAYVLEYFPSDGASSEFSIRIYFDSETFNHVRTEYYHDITPKQDVFGTLGRQAGTKLSLTEDFGNFKTVDGLTLPYLYKAVFTTSSNSGTFEYTWSIKIAEYYFNQKLAPDFFNFDSK